MSKNLEERVQDVLAIARERDQPGFSVEHEPAWQRRMKAACAQVFFLGMSAGWDKGAAAADGGFPELAVRTAIWKGRGRVLLDVGDGSAPGPGLMLDASAVRSILMEIWARAPELVRAMDREFRVIARSSAGEQA